jgi:CheY-like chemotaxis protein
MNNSEVRRSGTDWADLRQMPPAPTVGRPPLLTGRRVLVVEDNQDTARALAILFEMSGNKAETVHDGLAALDAAATFLPDVVLLDIGLPKLDGYEVARRLRKQPWAKNMVLVALTGWSHEEERKKSGEAGFDGHLVKPVQHAAVMGLLGKLLAGPRASNSP